MSDRPDAVEPATVSTPRRRKPRLGLTWKLAIVAVVPLLGKLFVVDVYPVREQSMWPALQGGADYVIVDRLSARFSAPARFDVCVFAHSDGDGNSHLYVKRVIGVSGDRMDFRGGDIVLEDGHGGMSIVQRPPDLVDAQMFRVFPPDGAWLSMLRVAGGSARGEAGALSIQPEPGGMATVDLLPGGGVDRRCFRDDHMGPDGRIVPGRNVVPDIRVDLGGVELGGGGLRISHELEGGEVRRVEIDPTGIAILGGTPESETRRGFFPGACVGTGIRIETVDGVFRVSRREGTGWRELFSEPRDTATYGSFSGLRIQARGGAITMRALEVLRDVHYGWASENVSGAVVVPSGKLFLVGDNVPVSIDSRDAAFGPIPLSSVVGFVRAVVRPFERVRRIR